jgi:hypothetical protein
MIKARVLTFLIRLGLIFAVIVAIGPLPAAADVQSTLEDMEKRLDEQEKLIKKQQEALHTQSQQLQKQNQQIREIRAENAPIDVDAFVNRAAANNLKSKGLTGTNLPVAEAPTAVVSVPAPPPSAQVITHIPPAPALPLPQEQNAQVTAPVTAPPVVEKQSPTPSGAAEKAEDISRTLAPATAPAMVEQERPQVQALADEGGVLSPKGMLTYENTFEYTNTTRNLFSFNGVELAQVVLVGAVNANSARHEVVEDTSRFRLGLTNRLEADVRVPYVYRNDAITNTTASTGATTQTTEQGYDIGDIDAGLAYQMSKGENGMPFFIGNLRYKANNADGPYDVPYDSNGNATRLPVGTGFQTFEASVTAIKVSDPAVLFGNLGYVYDMSRNINRDINTTYVGRVDPGDAINALIGMAFAINQDTSFSLGYKHSYVFSTIQHSQDIATGTPTTSSSGSQQVGAVTLGLSYAVTPTTPINFNVEMGVTNDAPDVHLLIRVPFQIGKIF